MLRALWFKGLGPLQGSWFRTKGLRGAWEAGMGMVELMQTKVWVCVMCVCVCALGPFSRAFAWVYMDT